MDVDQRELEELLKALYPFGNKFLENYCIRQAHPPTSWEKYYEGFPEHARQSWMQRLLRFRPS